MGKKKTSTRSTEVVGQTTGRLGCTQLRASRRHFQNCHHFFRSVGFDNPACAEGCALVLEGGRGVD